MNFIEATIPTIQYGNIHIHKEFTKDNEQEVLNSIIEYSVNFHNIVQILKAKEAEEGEELIINGVKWKKTKGKWQYLNTKTNQWEGGKQW